MHYTIFLLNSIFARFHHIFWSSWLKINFCAAMLAKHCSRYLTTLQVLYVFYPSISIYFSISFNFYEYFCGFYIYFYAHVAKRFVVVHILQRLIRCDTYVFKTNVFSAFPHLVRHWQRRSFCSSRLSHLMKNKNILIPLHHIIFYWN